MDAVEDDRYDIDSIDDDDSIQDTHLDPQLGPKLHQQQFQQLQILHQQHEQHRMAALRRKQHNKREHLRQLHGRADRAELARNAPDKKIVEIPAPLHVCSQILGLPDVFTSLKSHYGMFGFLDTADIESFLDVARPFISIKTVRQTNQLPPRQRRHKDVDENAEGGVDGHQNQTIRER